MLKKIRQAVFRSGPKGPEDAAKPVTDGQDAKAEIPKSTPEERPAKPRRRRRRGGQGTKANDQELSEKDQGAPVATDESQETGESSPPKRSRARKKRWSLEQFEVPEKPGEIRFHDLGLPHPIMHAIADLGFKYCTPIQAKVLNHAIAGQNVAGRAQTGTGKTAAFLISMFTRFLENPISGERPEGTPRALVLAPTRELAIQIVKDADDLGKYCRLNSVAVYGGLEVRKQTARLEKRPVDLIVATPGRLLDFIQRGVLDLKQIEELVIDEADRMLDMGFIPDVTRIIRKTPPKKQRRTMLFSATLTEDVLRLASQWMPDPVICEVEPEQVAVETVDQIVYIVTSRDKFNLLYNTLKQRDDARTLIFCNRRDRTNTLASKLARHGIPCELLSGAVPQKKRLRILEGFRDGTIKVVVATDVAGRGLHVKDIGLVVNYEFPYEPEDYVHRIGRTGRAGVAGTAISFACEDESFIIPDIEKYLGNSLTCTMPEPELLTPVKSRPRSQSQPESQPQSRPESRSRSRSRSRPRSESRSQSRPQRRRKR